MTWKTHLIGGAQFGVVAAGVAGASAEESAVIVSAAMLGSLLPDMDQPNSKLARSDSLVGVISHITSLFTSHRGFTHTIPGSAVIAGAFYLLALLKSEREGLVAFFAALLVFILMHACGHALRWFAGWAAVAVYMAGPHIASVLTDGGAEPSISPNAGILVAAGIFLGCISHILYDAFNKGVVMALYPFSRKHYRLASIKTDTAGEFGFACSQVAILTVMILLIWVLVAGKI